MDVQEHACSDCASTDAWIDVIQRLTRIEERLEAQTETLTDFRNAVTVKMASISTRLPTIERLDERHQALAQRVGVVESEVRDGRKESRVWSGVLTAATGLLGLLQAAFRK